MTANERAKAVERAHNLSGVIVADCDPHDYLAECYVISRDVLALDALLTATEKERDKWERKFEEYADWHGEAEARTVAAEKERDKAQRERDDAYATGLRVEAEVTERAVAAEKDNQRLRELLAHVWDNYCAIARVTVELLPPEGEGKPIREARS